MRKVETKSELKGKVPKELIWTTKKCRAGRLPKEVKLHQENGSPGVSYHESGRGIYVA